jgi:hypothetical protein
MRFLNRILPLGTMPSMIFGFRNLNRVQSTFKPLQTLELTQIASTHLQTAERFKVVW